MTRPLGQVIVLQIFCREENSILIEAEGDQTSESVQKCRGCCLRLLLRQAFVEKSPGSTLPEGSKETFEEESEPQLSAKEKTNIILALKTKQSNVVNDSNLHSSVI